MPSQTGELKQRPAQFEPQASSTTPGGFDLLDMLGRHFLAFTLTVALCGIAGGLYFLKAAPIYESVARVLIEKRASPTFTIQGVHDASMNTNKSIDTHTQILTSPEIVRRALETLHQQQQPLTSLSDVESEIAEVLENIAVRQEDASDVVSLTYRSKDENDCPIILSAVIDAYETFLSDANKNVGRETRELISDAKDELLETLTKKELTYQQFRETAPLIWEDGRGINPHQQRQINVEKTRSELEITRSEFSAKLSTIEKAIAAGDEEWNVAFFEAVRDLLPEIHDRSGSQQDENVLARETIRQFAEDYSLLANLESELSHEFGDGHPDLTAVRARMRQVEKKMVDLQTAILPSLASRMTPADYVDVYRRSLVAEIASLDKRLMELEAMYAKEQEKASAIQVFVAQDRTFQKDIERTQKLFDAVVDRLGEQGISQDHAGDRISMLAVPETGYLVAPNLIRCVAGGILSGALLGFGIVYLVDRSEATFRSVGEVRSTLMAPVIGLIPKLVADQRATSYPHVGPMVVTVHRDGGHAAEAFRAVRTSLFFNTVRSNHQVIQISSPLPGDGKSTLAANLAVTIAKSGKRCLLIDADFRRPNVHQLFGLQRDRAGGLSEVVDGAIEPIDANLETEIENLFVMTSGPKPANPSEILSSPEFKELLEMLRDRFDFIVVDTPPLLAVTDPSVVAAYVDATVVTVRVRRGSQVAARRAREILAGVDANVIGVVVNALEDGAKFGEYEYGYRKHGYGYGYGSQATYPADVDQDNNTPTPPRLRELTLHESN